MGTRAALACRDRAQQSKNALIFRCFQAPLSFRPYVNTRRRPSEIGQSSKKIPAVCFMARIPFKFMPPAIFPAIILARPVLSILLFVGFTTFSNAQNLSAGYDPAWDKLVNVHSLERRVFVLINQTRVENGLKRLIWNEEIAAIARRHSANMATNNFFSHVGLDGKKVSDRAAEFGLTKWQMIGENIAYNFGFDDPIERAFEGWMNSRFHRRNLLRVTWRETGIGVAV